MRRATMKFNGIIGFVIGAVAGSSVTWYIIKKKYNQEAREEVEAVRAYYKEKYGEVTMDNKEEKEAEPASSIAEKATNANEAMASLKKYYTVPDEPDNKEGDKMSSCAYVITPEQFASTREYYAKNSLSLWSDGVITEDDNSHAKYTDQEINRMIGIVNLKRMGEYEPNVLYVRNDILQTDFEIIEEGTPYSEL